MRGPAGTLCSSGTMTPRPRAVPGSGTAAVEATTTDSTHRKNVKSSVSLVSSKCAAEEGSAPGLVKGDPAFGRGLELGKL